MGRIDPPNTTFELLPATAVSPQKPQAHPILTVLPCSIWEENLMCVTRIFCGAINFEMAPEILLRCLNPVMFVFVLAPKPEVVHSFVNACSVHHMINLYINLSIWTTAQTSKQNYFLLIKSHTYKQNVAIFSKLNYIFCS